MRFNLSVIGNIIGILLMINGMLMLTAIPFALYHSEESWKGIFISSLINLIIGFFLYFRTKNTKNKDLKRRDGYLIVTSSWIFMCLFGMLPAWGVIVSPIIMYFVGIGIYKLVINKVVDRDLFISILATFGISILFM